MAVNVKILINKNISKHAKKMFSRIIHHRNFVQNRLLSTLVSLQKSKDIDHIAISKITSTRQHDKELQNFFNRNESLTQLKEHLMPHLLKRTFNPSAIYLIDKEVAELIARAIRKKITIKNIKNVQILEVNPGLGVLTDELIDKGFQNIHLFETKTHFVNYLTDKYKDQDIYLTCADFFSIWKLAYQDRFDNGTRVADLLNNFKFIPWTSESSGMNIIGSIPSVMFIKHMIYSIILQVGLILYGRPEMFLIMQPSIYSKLTAQPDDGFFQYRSTSVLFQLLFNSEIIEKLPRQAYLPWQSFRIRKRTTSSSMTMEDLDHIYLVHISGKKELPVPHNQLQSLWYFVRQHMLSRKNRVIPQMERWIPGSGSRFISEYLRNKEKRDDFKHIGIFTQFGELPPAQILEIYKQFVSMPEYEECPFLASMETSLLKLETTEECASAVEVTDAIHHEEDLKDANSENVDKSSS